jgi:hypothetical protein
VLLDDKIPDLWESNILAWKFFLLDPKKTPMGHLTDAGEPLVPSLKATMEEELLSFEPSLDGLWDMNLQKMKIVHAYHKLVVENELDAILMPGNSATAVPHDTYGITPFTVLQNLLNVSLVFSHCVMGELTRFVNSIRPLYCLMEMRMRS